MGAYTPPVFTAPAPFKPPTQEEIQNDPSYQFRLGQGRKALESSAAARGTLRSGGTLKDILEYGQNLGAQQYDTAYNRARQQYEGDYDRALRQYDIERQNAMDKWKSDWEQYVYATTPRGGGGRQYEDVPPPPEAPGGDPYAPEDPYADGGDPYGGNPYTPEDPYGGQY